MIITVLLLAQLATPAQASARIPVAQAVAVRRAPRAANDPSPADTNTTGGRLPPGTNPDTLPDDFFDNDPDGTPGASGDDGSPVDPNVAGFLADAVKGLTDNDVVRAACKGTQWMQQYQQVLGQSQDVLSLWRGLSQRFGGSGVPVMDNGVAGATSAYAKAVELGAKAESYSATYAIGALCNTSETARLAGAQFDFLRHVVNRGIELDLPDLQRAVNDTRAGLDPVASDVRQARYERLFGRYDPQWTTRASVSGAVLDSTTAEAYQMAAHADSLANAVMPQLSALAAEVQGTDQTGCAALMGTGDSSSAGSGPRSNGRCGPISPGRADQITATALLLNGSQMAMLNQLSARRMDVEAAKAQVDLRSDYLARVGRLRPAVRP